MSAVFLRKAGATPPLVQRVAFLRADPLRLELAPVAGGLRATIENPGLTLLDAEN